MGCATCLLETPSPNPLEHTLLREREPDHGPRVSRNALTGQSGAALGWEPKPRHSGASCG